MPGGRISVIVPVAQAGGAINALVDHIRVVGYGTDLEIVVADGDPAARTLAALTRPGVLALTAGPGPAAQRNAGAAAAQGDILLFLQPDTRLPVGAFQAVADVLAGPADAGAFPLAVHTNHPGWRLLAFAANLRTRLCGLACGDQAVFVRRDLFRAVGGFPDRPGLEDLAFMRALVRAGTRVRLVAKPVAAPEERLRSQGLGRTVRRGLTRCWRLLRAAGRRV